MWSRTEVVIARMDWRPDDSDVFFRDTLSVTTGFCLEEKPFLGAFSGGTSVRGPELVAADTCSWYPNMIIAQSSSTFSSIRSLQPFQGFCDLVQTTRSVYDIKE